MEATPENPISTLSSIEGSMNSWYLPAFPAAVALSYIAYSFWVAF
jgi:hypothetical protein